MKVADGIMIARGDMGIEIPLEEVPVVQREILRKCNETGKLVITATQMLESMQFNPRPTRAEANDVATAVYLGTEATMLSGETATGKYPVHAVKMMARIDENTEKYADICRNEKYIKHDLINMSELSTMIYSTVAAAKSMNVKAIITVSKTGEIAETVASFFPHCPVFALTDDETVLRQMNFRYAVYPDLIQIQNKEIRAVIQDEIPKYITKGYLSKDDVVMCIYDADDKTAVVSASNDVKILFVYQINGVGGVMKNLVVQIFTV
jgi:pyruvate kinase